MFSFRNAVVSVAVMAAVGLAAAQTGSSYPGVGRAATPKEVAAWDIDVRPDFKGLPAGSGTVAKGQDVWESKCASCHGVFGDSNEVFSPLIGGTTAEDVKTGRVAKLRDPTAGRTTIMKVATLSTLWDYINRAMPWTQPKSLSTEEVYSVTAFLLNLGGVVPDNFTLSDKNIAEVQARMPNRNGMTTQHAMWPGNEFNGAKVPDVKNTACMKNCAAEPKVASFLPDFARNAHGNLAEQNRLVGPQRGADTTRPEGKAFVSGAATAPAAAVTAKVAAVKVADTPKPAAAPAGGADSKAAQALAQKNNCTACHAIDGKLIGPSFADIARKHAGKADYLAGKIKSGGSGVWGPIPMPAQSLGETEAKALAAWLATGATK
ncbi:MAG: c-type cytochrome [Polaromonas sp.]